MDGFTASIADRLQMGGRTAPGAAFGHAAETPRPLDIGMGTAVARRTVFRPEDAECFGRVADRVAEGNFSLLNRPPDAAGRLERLRLRNAIASGALLTSGRHLQHGDASQATRNMEVFTNCATAIASFAKFYLLLNGSGVGRSYDDALIAIDWAEAPTLLLHLSPEHPDYPHSPEALCQVGVDLGLLPWGSTDPGPVREYLARELLADPAAAPAGAVLHRIADSREGWAKAVELLEAMSFRRERDGTLVLDFSDIRPAGAPIRGMQGRPASGPVSLVRAFLNIRRHVIDLARARNPAGAALRPWEQALLIDHFFSVEVQVGGARRAARMATKSWRDPAVLRFIAIKRRGRAMDRQPLRHGRSRILAAYARATTPTRSPATPARYSPKPPAAPTSTANPASSTATNWKTTAPAAPGKNQSMMTAATSAVPATRWTTRPRCSPNYLPWPPPRATPSPPTRAARSRCTSPAATASSPTSRRCWHARRRWIVSYPAPHRPQSPPSGMPASRTRCGWACVS